MRDILITTIVFGVLLMAFKHPHYGIYMWSWLSYMNPHKQAWGFAFDFPFAAVTAGVTIVAYFLSREPKRVVWTPEIVLLVLLFGWMVFTTFFAFYPQLAWMQLEKVWKIQLMTLVTLMLMNDRHRLHGLVWIIALSIGYYGIKGGIFTIATGGANRVWGPEGTFIGGNNEIALALIMIVPLFRYLHLQEKRRLIRYGLAAAMVLCAVSAIGSQSRGALLAIVAMGFFLWLKSRNKVVTGFYALIAISLIVLVMPPKWYERMQTIQEYEEDGSAMGRINAWHVAFNVALDRNTGGGFEMFQPGVFSQFAPNPWDVHDVHSIYFEIMGEHGFIGFALWFMLGLLAWIRASKIIRACKDDPDRKWAADLAAMTQVSMVGYATGGAFLGLAYFDLYYHLIVIIVLTHQFAITEASGNTRIAGNHDSPGPLPHHASRWGRSP